MATKTRRKTKTETPAEEEAPAEDLPELGIIRPGDESFQQRTSRDKISPVLDPLLQRMIDGEEEATIQLVPGEPFSVAQIRNWYSQTRQDGTSVRDTLEQENGKRLKIGGGDDENTNIKLTLEDFDPDKVRPRGPRGPRKTKRSKKSS